MTAGGTCQVGIPKNADTPRRVLRVAQQATSVLRLDPMNRQESGSKAPCNNDPRDSDPRDNARHFANWVSGGSNKAEVEK